MSFGEITRMREPESRPGGQIDRPPPEPPPTPRTHPHDTPPRRVSGNMSSPTDGTASPVGTTLGIALRDAKRKDTRRSYHHSVIHEKTKAHRSATDLSEDIFDRPISTRDNDTENTAKGCRQRTPAPPRPETPLHHKKRKQIQPELSQRDTRKNESPQIHTDLTEDIFDRTEPAPQWCN